MFSLLSLLALPCLLRYTVAQSGSTACNNSPLLCDRAYDNVTYLGSHNAPFIRDSSNGFSQSGNQYYNTTMQLGAGVRLLSGQLHNTNSSNPSSGSWNLCHTSCSLLDAGPLRDWLSEIKTWLDANPNEVVTVLLVNSDDASASDIAAQYSAAGIESYTYKPNSTTTAPTSWPSLQTLIDDGTRLLSFVADLSENNTVAPYLMNEFTYIFENDYDNADPSDFSCTANRPSTVNGNTASALSQNLMPLMNHFLYNNESQIFGLSIEVPDADAANVTNAASGGTGNLGDAATQCVAAYGTAPTYILVDFFNVGPAITTVDRLNGVTAAVGRTNVSVAAVSISGAGHRFHFDSWLVIACTVLISIVLLAA